MRIALVAATIAILCGPAWAEDESIEWSVPRSTYFVGERIPLVVRVSYGPRLEEFLVPLFVQKVDVPLELLAPLPRETDAANPIDDPTLLERAGGSTRSVSVDGRIVRASWGVWMLGSMITQTLHVPRPLRAIRSGDLELAAPRLRFATATAFEEDFLTGRVPVDRKDVVVEGKPLAIRVLALPEEGRPLEFAGAIGRFTVGARVASTRVRSGESMALTFTIEGEGNLDAIATPQIALDGFHVRGVVESDPVPVDGAARRTLRYDVVPVRGDVTAIPPIAFAFFDPEAGVYRTARTDAIPIDLEADPTPSVTYRAHAKPAPWGRIVRVAVLAIVAALLAWAFIARRRRAARGDDVPVPSPVATDAARGTADPGDPESALARALAGRLGCSTAAVITPDLRARLESAGVPADLAARAASLMERVVAARYGGEAVDDAAARALVVELLGSLR